MKVWDNIIIGAGLSGLLLARRLVDSGAEVLIIEKSKSVGGRMATRRDGDAAFDHGAQHSTADLKKHFANDFWKPWVAVNNETKYTVIEGMNKAGKYLAQGLNVRLNEKVIRLKSGDCNTVEVESGGCFSARRIFLTCPVPQSLELLSSANISFPENLKQIVYAKALVGLLRLESSNEQIRKFSHAENVGNKIFSVSNQKSKGVSESLAFTIVMDPIFSETYFHSDEAESLLLIENCFANFVMRRFNINESDFAIIRSQLKKWKYSHPVKSFGAEYLSLNENKVFLIGDGFAGGGLARVAASALAVPIKPL